MLKNEKYSDFFPLLFQFWLCVGGTLGAQLPVMVLRDLNCDFWGVFFAVSESR